MAKLGGRRTCLLRVVCRDPGKFGDNAVQFIDDPIGSRFPEDGEECVEVPDLLVATALEASPDLVADFAVVIEHGSRIVEFVGGGDELNIRPFAAKAEEI